MGQEQTGAATSWFFVTKPDSDREATFGRLLLACMQLSSSSQDLLADFCSHALGLGAPCYPSAHALRGTASGVCVSASAQFAPQVHATTL